MDKENRKFSNLPFLENKIIKMEDKKARSALGTVLVVVAFMALMIYFVTADTECVGQDCSVGTSLTVGNSAPTIINVETGITVTLTGESTTNTANVTFNVTDTNGFADINDSTAQCVGFKSGESSRTSSNCAPLVQSGNDASYDCAVDFQYFDAAASNWAWNCTISDNSAVNATNDTVSFTINALNFVDVNVTTVSWAVVNPNITDEEADDPINLDNGGNQDYETAFVTAFNATDGGSNVIPASVFSLYNLTGQTAGQTYMAENVSTNITSFFTLQHGNTASEDIFVYVDMPSVPTGSYTSTSNWLIDITA